MQKFFILLLCFLFLEGCNTGDGKDQVASATQSWSALDSLPTPAVINTTAREILGDWPQFESLEKRIAVLPEVDNREELKLLVEELIQISKQIEINAIPEPFEQPSVRSRHKVVRTYLEKVDAALYYRLDHREPLLELMDTYNALREQFNVIVNSTLTPEIFENE